MEIIETIAPISIEDLKKYFVNQDTKYIIDYKNSKLQGIKLLTYLSNLDIPCDLKIEENSDEFFNLIKDYLSCPFLVNVHTIEVAVIGILLAHKGLIKVPEYEKFIEENQNILDEWQGIFADLLREGIRVGVYVDENYIMNPQNYCGLILDERVI